MDWQPIETAPKDRPIRAKIEDTRDVRVFVLDVIWSDIEQDWRQSGAATGLRLRYVPTHWKPLPEA